MSTPSIYYHNLLGLGVLSGTNVDEAYRCAALPMPT